MTIPLRSLALAVLSTLAIVPAACGDEEGGGEAVETSTTTSAPEAAEEVTLAANLSGKEEVPDAGVTDGSGVAEVKIAGDELCYKLNATMGEKPTLAHIHTGAAGVAGDVLVNLMPTFAEGESGFTAESCLKPDAAALASIQADPAGFYVNVHSAEHPKGAMRGQLAAGSGGGGTGGGTSGGSTTTT
ncbi:MAG: CHRD domain-containing protein, partial [Acidimicrobiia bacterium]